MNVILATPFFNQLRGNTITVRRMAGGLERAGINTKVISITEQVPKPLSLQNADLIHGFNAFRFYQFMKTLNAPITNYIITLTGTDLNHDLKNKDRKQDVVTCLKEALAVHVFEEEAKQRVFEELPELKNRVYVIAQGTNVAAKHSLSARKQRTPFTFLLPAGIRKVKNVPFAIKGLQPLRATHPGIQLKIVGPIIEKEEGETVRQLVSEQSDWVSYAGVIPHNEMTTLYHQADVVLNTSHTEGQSSAILEAMGQGLPVLVSQNKGNMSVVKHGSTGLIYNGNDEFTTHAASLINDSHVRTKLGRNAREYVKNYHSAELEIKAIVKMYEESFHS
ncbi:glycosyltransferase [Pseudalkalibacillus hwajinpoensis]|uniref:glycosyltransferase n=1 Tax=Guptibacillus hwajinpoensis TaxID=208199 RepID=UPI00325AA6CF